MFHKRIVMAALALGASACATGVLAGSSSGSAQAHHTIGLVRGTDSGFFDDVQKGAKAESTALGDRLLVQAADNAQSAIAGLTAQHVDAIAVDPGERGSGSVLDGSSLAAAHAAGIATLWYRNPSNGTSVWVNMSTETAFAHGLADALAAQMGKKGGYAIVPCRPAYPVVQTRLRAIEAYVRARYPKMKRIAVVYGNDAANAAETAMFSRFIKRHPSVRGLIALCPAEAFVVPHAIVQTGKTGKVFSSGNGGDYTYAPIDPGFVHNVRSGAEELVVPGDPVKLGYLTAWAADYLASGHTFAPGQYNVGGPVGSVLFTGQHELRLGEPLTITKDNLDQYVGP